MGESENCSHNCRECGSGCAPICGKQLIDKILVSECEKSADGTVKQEIKIYYKFIGFAGELHIIPTKRWTALPAKHCTVCGVE